MDQKKQSKSNAKIHILFFTSSLGTGGAEMHLLRIINHLDREKFRLSLALVRSGGTYESSLESDVTVHPLNTGKINSSTLRMIRSLGPLRKVIRMEQPDILCSVMDRPNIVATLAARVLPKRPKIVLSVQNTLSVKYNRSWNILHRAILWLIQRLYPQADCVVSLSQGVAEDLLTLVPTINDRIEVIYNAGVDAVVLSRGRELVSEEAFDGKSFLIVACGRLTEQKGFPYLINALVDVLRVVPARLWIIGEGKQRQSLKKQIQHLGLTDSICLLGFKNNPYKYMAAADVFVLSSLWEGFGNVVVEAMAAGAPVIATNCPHGPSEIIRDGVSGILVPPASVEVLSAAIINVLTDQELRRKLSQKGQQRSQDFHAQTIASNYEEMFFRVAGTRRR